MSHRSHRNEPQRKTPNASLTEILEVVPPPPLEESFTAEELASFTDEEKEWMRREGGYVRLRHLDEVIQEAEQPQEVWLWCLHCERFFQLKHLRRDSCPFCGAAGLSVDIFLWNTQAVDNPRWPASIDELSYGMRSPSPQ